MCTLEQGTVLSMRVLSPCSKVQLASQAQRDVQMDERKASGNERRGPQMSNQRGLSPV